MGRPLNADGRQTRLAILDAALDLFADKGYFGTTLRDIATAVGVRESALYNYFKSKDALFSDLLTSAREQTSGQLAEQLADPIADPRKVLERLTAFLLERFSEPRQQQLFRVLMSDGMRLAREGRLDLIERMTSGAAPFRDLMARLVTNGSLRPRDPQLLAIEFLGPLLLWRHWYAILPDVPVIANRKAFVREHVDSFLQGAALRTSGRVNRVQPRRPIRRRTRARLA
jgi:AcrR family transcriptional regulator